MLGAGRWSHVVLCSYVPPEEGLDLLTACLQTVGGRYLLQ